MADAWAIEGVEVPGSVARMLAYVAAGGAEGVVEPGGLKAAPLAVPGGSVRVMPGAALVLNRFPGGGQQAYAVQEQAAATVPIVATGSGGGRTDLVIARVRDEQYGAGPAGVTFEVIQGVPAGAGAAYVQALAYPALALARVTLPASTGTVQAAHITDLRALARPRVESVVRMGAPTSGVALTSSGGTVFPPGFTPSILIPSWATHMSVVATIASIGYQTNSVAGTFAVRAGAAGASQWRSANTAYDLDLVPGDSARETLVVGGDAPIHADLRGSVQTFAVEGRRDAGAGSLVTRPGTHLIFQVQFREEAV